MPITQELSYTEAVFILGRFWTSGRKQDSGGRVGTGLKISEMCSGSICKFRKDDVDSLEHHRGFRCL